MEPGNVAIAGYNQATRVLSLWRPAARSKCGEDERTYSQMLSPVCRVLVSEVFALSSTTHSSTVTQAHALLSRCAGKLMLAAHDTPGRAVMQLLGEYGVDRWWDCGVNPSLLQWWLVTPPLEVEPGGYMAHENKHLQHQQQSGLVSPLVPSGGSLEGYLGKGVEAQVMENVFSLTQGAYERSGRTETAMRTGCRCPATHVAPRTQLGRH